MRGEINVFSSEEEKPFKEGEREGKRRGKILHFAYTLVTGSEKT
jgi:hypothetical protein